VYPPLEVTIVVEVEVKVRHLLPVLQSIVPLDGGWLIIKHFIIARQGRVVSSGPFELDWIAPYKVQVRSKVGIVKKRTLTPDRLVVGVARQWI